MVNKSGYGDVKEEDQHVKRECCDVVQGNLLLVCAPTLHEQTNTVPDQPNKRMPVSSLASALQDMISAQRSGYVHAQVGWCLVIFWFGTGSERGGAGTNHVWRRPAHFR